MSTNIKSPVKRYHRIDGWRGYPVPALAVIGASDTGTWPDSPCPTPLVKQELKQFQKILRGYGIHSRTRFGGSSNLFCGKRWLVVPRGSFHRAAELALAFLSEHRLDTHYIHDASLEQLGYQEGGVL